MPIANPTCSTCEAYAATHATSSTGHMSIAACAATTSNGGVAFPSPTETTAPTDTATDLVTPQPGAATPDPDTPTSSDAQIYIVTEPDTDSARVRAELEQLAAAYPMVEIQDQDQYMGGIASQLNMILNVLLGLLALSVGLLALRLVEVKMLPFDNKSEFQVILDLPEGTALETSHALAQGYARSWRFDLGVFTNLSVDHFGTHGSWEHYLAAKAQLFMHLGPGRVAVWRRNKLSCVAAGGRAPNRQWLGSKRTPGTGVQVCAPL